MTVNVLLDLMIILFTYMKHQDLDHGKNQTKNLKDIHHILLILIGQKKENIYKVIAVLMKFFSGTQKPKRDYQVEHQCLEMKNGQVGLVLLDSLFKKSGEVVKMEQMLMLLIDPTFKLKVLKLKVKQKNTS
jgi:hypothetical protein